MTPNHDIKYILKGREIIPVNLKTWADWFEASLATGDRRIGLTERDGVQVSTVFLGIDHSFHLGGPPILFETLVFGGPCNECMERYFTYDEAEKGHEKWVKIVHGEWDADFYASLSERDKELMQKVFWYKKARE